MSGPLRKKKDHKCHKTPIEWLLDLHGDDIYDERQADDDCKHRMSALRSQIHKLKKRVKLKKQVMAIDRFTWSFHNGNHGSAYRLSALDDAGKTALETISSNSFSSAYEAKVVASLLGYEAYESGCELVCIE